MKKLIFGLLIIVRFSFSQTLDATHILEKVQKQFEGVNDYTALITAKVDMERLKIPEMKVKIYFKQPNKLHIESSNFAMLPKEGLGMNPGEMLKKFDATLLGTEQQNGTPIYKVRLVSKPEKNKPIHENIIYVDGARWLITRFESVPNDGRKISVDFEHTLVDGKYLLPQKLTANFSMERSADSLTEKIYSPQRMPRRGSVVVEYSEYKVNAGLSDDIFVKKEKEKK